MIKGNFNTLEIMSNNVPAINTIDIPVKGKKVDLISTVTDQYSKGNIRVVPQNVFEKLIAYAGITNILS